MYIVVLVVFFQTLAAQDCSRTTVLDLFWSLTRIAFFLLVRSRIPFLSCFVVELDCESFDCVGWHSQKTPICHKKIYSWN